MSRAVWSCTKVERALGAGTATAGSDMSGGGTDALGSPIVVAGLLVILSNGAGFVCANTKLAPAIATETMARAEVRFTFNMAISSIPVKAGEMLQRDD